MQSIVCSICYSFANCHLYDTIEELLAGFYLHLTEDFGEVKTAPTEYEEKYFQMISSAYGKAPQDLLMLMIHLRKR